MRFWPWMSPRSPAPASGDYARYDAHSKLLDRNGRWIEVADAKAGAVLVFLTAAFPGLSSTALTMMPKLAGAIPTKPIWTDFVPLGVLVVLTALFTGLSLLTLIYVLLVFRPRMARSRKPGHIFFADVAACNFEGWAQELAALDLSTLTEEVLEQVYSTACIATVKHQYVQRAWRWVFWAVLSGLAVFVASHLLQ